MSKKNPDFGSGNVSRRNFLKKTALFTLGTAAIGHSLAAAVTGKGAIALVVSPDDDIASSLPGTWALSELKSALESQGTKVRIIHNISDADIKEFCVIPAGMKSPLAQRIISQQKIAAPTGPESLCLAEAKMENRTVLLAAGVDRRGLVYALTELADRVSCLATGSQALEFAKPVIERPASRIRSVMRSFSSDIEDKVWFYDRDFWRNYLTMLVSSRVNRFSFTMGMSYNSANNIKDGYLLFPYPFFVDVEGYNVRPKGLSDEERKLNFDMLKFIGEECVRRGLLFQFSVWTLAYKWTNSANATWQIEGLTDTTHGDYCRDALALILREVPAITGVTFRVHSESGIPKGQKDFWKTQFSAIEKCGRTVELDMHAKNMELETLDSAIATGQPTVISPKIMGEHMGLPYHQTSIRTKERSPAGSFTDTGVGLMPGNRSFTRSGYADTLAENRNWDVVFRIWPGTQRFLLRGDPALFAGYGRNASFCGAAGIEFCEPLFFKGRHGSGIAGGRCAYADATLTPRYDFEKYLYTYRLWGRLGYNPDEDPEVWRRALRRDFGKAAVAVENALGPVTRVLPLFTVVHGESTDCGTYWPEIYRNMTIADETMNKTFKDVLPPVLFGSVCPFDPQIFQTPYEYGDALVNGNASGKYSPIDVAQWFENAADASSSQIAVARKLLGAGASAPAFRRIEEDVLIQCGLAHFFAGKLRSAVLWQIFTLTGNRSAGEAAIASFTVGRNAWAAMAERAKGVYISNITYGSHKGHWSDRIAAFDQDIADLRQKLENPAQPLKTINPATAKIASATAAAKPDRPVPAVQHTPAEKFVSGQPLVVALHTGKEKLDRVILYYRHVNQAENWESVELARSGDSFQGGIPPDYTSKRYALQYYFEIVTSNNKVTLYPPLAADLANVPYFVVRRKA